MPLPTIPDCYRVALNWEISGRTATNVIHILNPDGDESDIFDALDANVSSSMWQVVNDSASVKTVVVTKLDGTPDGRVFATAAGTPGNWDGGLGGEYIPQVCMLVKLLTNATGRSGRGRIYLPFTSEGGQNGGTIPETPLAAAQTAWEDFANALIANTPSMALAVASYKLSEANQVIAVQVEDKTATIRRRNRQ